jgi:hypothetical protein
MPNQNLNADPIKMTNVAEVSSEVSSWGGMMIDGQLSPHTTIALMDRDSNLVSVIKDVQLERHEDGTQTMWLMIEEM